MTTTPQTKNGHRWSRPIQRTQSGTSSVSVVLHCECHTSFYGYTNTEVNDKWRHHHVAVTV